MRLSLKLPTAKERPAGALLFTFVVLVILVAALVVAIIRHPLKSSGPAASSEWRMYGLNPAHQTIIDDPALKLPQNVSWTAHIPGKPIGQAMSAMATGEASYSGGYLYADTLSGKLVKINPTTGEIVWTWRGPNQIMTTPVFYQTGHLSLVIVGLGNNVMTGMSGPRSAYYSEYYRGTGPSGVYAVNEATGVTVWSFRTRGEAMPTPVVTGGRVFAPTGGRHLYVLDAATGRLVRRIPDFGFDSMSSPVLARGLVIFGVNDPEEYLAYDVRSLSLRWAFEMPSAVGGMSPPAEAHGIAVFEAAVVPQRYRTITKAVLGEYRQYAYGVRLSDGKLLWRRDLGRGLKPSLGMIAGGACILGGTAYMLSPVTGYVYALDVATGAELWSTTLPGAVPNHGQFPGGIAKGHPVLYNGRLYVGAADKSVWELDPKTGKIVGKVALPGPATAAGPLILNGRLVVLTANGDVVMRGVSSGPGRGKTGGGA